MPVEASYHSKNHGSTQEPNVVDDVSENIAVSLVDLARSDSSGARGIRAILWVFGAAKSHQVQPLGGCYYIELCPAYLTTCEGVTSWSARTAWSIASDLIGWCEVTAEDAANLGASLRQKAKGRRFGRHIIIDGTQLLGIRSAYAFAVRDGILPEPEAPTTSSETEKTIELKRLPSPSGSVGGRTVAASCPRHEDKHPSLVLWRNADSVTGGALCMSCRVKYAVRYHGKVAYLRPPRGCQELPPIHQEEECQPRVSTGPVGGNLATDQSGYYVGASLSADLAGTLSRSRGGRLTGDPIKVLQWSDSRSKGPSAIDRAGYLSDIVDINQAPPEAWIPTSLTSVSRMVPDSWEPTRWGWRPSGWKAVRQDWILIDIDNVRLSKANESKMGERISRVVRRDKEASGRSVVIRTGPNGIQVWVELREARSNPSEWHRIPEVVSWYSDLGARILSSIHKSGGKGGHVDLACCAAGRFARRPGWRVLSNGKLWRTRLILACESRVRGRKPRT